MTVEKKFAPLWEKGTAPSDTMQRLTVGSDPKYDAALFLYDCLGSAAQAKVLHKAGIISEGECKKLLGELQKIFKEASSAEVTIPYQLEDCHTLLESLLTESCGEVGKKIHTGRSRNDQVITATRLFLRENITKTLERITHVSKCLSDVYEKNHDIFLPGYTHLQPAMPSSVGMYIHSLYEWSLELIKDGIHLLSVIDKNPLGSAAGFGSSLPIDRMLSATAMGFSGVQRSYIDVQNSRGRYEERYLYWLSSIGSLFEKFAWDMELFFTKEFSLISLPDSMTTGSSIMPQKKNPDIIELLRGRCALQRSFVAQIQAITSKLPSNYHRDLALVKQPLFQGVENIEFVLGMAELILPAIQFNRELLEQRKSEDPELFATYAAYQKVKSGVPFRDAYKETAKDVLDGKITSAGYENEYAFVIAEVASGMKEAQAEYKKLDKEIHATRGAINAIYREIFVL